jgi:hypothetical protein
VHELRELLAAFFGERGERDSDDLAIIGRVEPEVRASYRLFDGSHQRRVERLRDDEGRFGNRERRHLIDRDARAVSLDLHRIEDGDRRTPRADAGKLAPDVLQLRVHPFLDLCEQAFQISSVHAGPR